MFLHLSVILFTGGVICLSASPREAHRPPGDGYLLECILVLSTAFVSCRLYVPLNESQLTLVAQQEASKHMHGEYILLGVEEAETLENNKTWYWRSGQKITSPWCPGQPDDHADQKILIVTRDPPHCLHDDRISMARRFICQEGILMIYCYTLNLGITF